MQNSPFRVLLVETERTEAHQIRRILADAEPSPCDLLCATRLATALKHLRKGAVDVVLLNPDLPDSRGLDALARIQAQAPRTPVVVLVDPRDGARAVQAVQAGAQNLLLRNRIDVRSLQRVLRYPAEKRRRGHIEDQLRATEDEFRVARRIQQRLFPDQSPALEGFEIAGTSFPAEATGGDYYDFIPLADGSVGVAIGDVSGHGFGPALLMAEARAYLRAFAQVHSDIRQILSATNDVLLRDTEEDRFITLFYARLETGKKMLRFTSAGHPTGYLLNAGGDVKARLQSTSLPLAVLPGAEFATETCPLRRGDLVVLCTDGVLEAESPEGEQFGAGRLLDLVRAVRHRSASEISEQVCAAARDFCGPEGSRDDLTLVLVKVTGRGRNR